MTSGPPPRAADLASGDPEPPFVCELRGNFVSRRIDASRFKLREPTISLGLRQLRAAPRTEGDRHLRRTAVVNDDAVLPELRKVGDEAVRAIESIGMPWANEADLSIHLLATMPADH